MRFLFHWQGLDDPGEGEGGLSRALGQMEGLSLPAACWEDDVLPARVQPYSRAELDGLCGAGQVLWLRLQVPTPGKEPKRRTPAVRSTPITFIARAHLAHWRAFTPQLPAGELPLSGAARTVYDGLRAWGASFFDELLAETGLLRTQLEEALGELAAWGLVTCDSFRGLRELILPQRLQRRRHAHPERLAAAGRWSLLRPAAAGDTDALNHAEHIARVLLRRYGVVFRRVLERESGLPSWRELLYVYRRLEARGELRGGRFVQGFPGEQYALPAAVSALREIRNRARQGDLITLSAADPLNLTGIVTPGRRIGPQPGHRLLYRDGVPIAVSAQREITLLEAVDPRQEWHIRNALLRKPHPSAWHPPPSRPV
jgi:ATP-dependent Lhr-like helicase